MANSIQKLESYAKNFIYKSYQVVAQARQGRRLRTESKPVSPVADWFNLGIDDLPKVRAELKQVLPTYTLSPPNPIVNIEVSLKTQEGAVVIELWTISLVGEMVPIVPELPPTVLLTAYTDLGMLLRSLCVMSHSLPAYRLARQQRGSAPVMDTRIYVNTHGTSKVVDAGEGCVLSQLGSVNMLPTNSGCTLSVSVTYRIRTGLAFISSLIPNGPMETKLNHFEESTIEAHDRAPGTGMDFSDTVGRLTSEPVDLGTNGHTKYDTGGVTTQYRQLELEPLVSPAADAKESKRGGAFVLLPMATVADPVSAECSSGAAPFSALLHVSDVLCYEDADVACTGMDPGQPIECAAGPDPDEAESLESLEKENDFIMIQLKTPFVPTSDPESDLSSFFRSCQHLPDLQMFHRGPAVRDTLEHITEDLSMFESKLPVFDEFVNSLQSMSERSVYDSCGWPS